MSTDTPDAPPLAAPPRKGYAFYEHHNSNNSRRRGGRVDGGLFKSNVTIRTVRFPDGGPLPHVPSPPSRSRYTPHYGKKQLAKVDALLGLT